MNFQNQNRKKQKSEKNFSVLQNQIIIKGLQIEARGITNRGNFKDIKSGKIDYKLIAPILISPQITNQWKEISNRGKDYILG